jgi:4-nitrophenyl phosphatase
MVFDLLNHIHGLIIDMDGVLWRDTEPLGDLEAVFSKINDLSLRTILATNNSTRTIEEYHHKLAGFGVYLEDWQIINSAQAVGLYISEHYPEGISIYVVGQPSLKNTLVSFGLRIANENDSDVQIVVASMDFHLTYEKLKHASLLIQAGCDFIGTNPDKTLPTPEGFYPGSGTIIGALEIASGKSAKIIGKPEPLLYQMALKRLSLDPEDTLAIGDRLETDIAGAQAAGIHTALVLTGASTLAQAKNFKPQPEIITQDLTELIFKCQ